MLSFKYSMVTEIPRHLIQNAQQILSADDAAEICHYLLAALHDLLSSSKVSVWLTHTRMEQAVLYLDNGLFSPDQITFDETWQQKAASRALDTQKPVFHRSQGARQLFAPLSVRGKAVGVVEVELHSGEQAFNAKTVQQITFLASQAAAAIEIDRLFWAEQERLRVGGVLIDASQRLSQDLKPEELPARILAELAEVVTYERGSLLMQDGDVLRIAAQRGFPYDPRVSQLNISLRQGDVYYQIVESNRPVLIDDVTKEAGWQQVDWLQLNLSWLGLPLFAKDKVVGMVSLTRRASGAFSQEDVLMASAFAMQASVALENAHLYAEILRFNQELELIVQQRTEQLRQALNSLERLDKNKSDFINMAAHELRTPLTVMKGYLGMLEGDAAVKTSPFLLQVRDGIEKGTGRLHEIINSMLDLARIDNQVLDLKTEPVAVPMVIRRVRSDFLPFLEERHQELELVGMEGLPPVQGDPTLLLKVFHNVVINAIKYTPDGGKISITGCQTQDETLGDCIEIQVKDTGIGIDPDQQELIFEKLYSTGKVALHSSGKASYKGGGPGLGLAIARGIVLAHHGRIWAESERHDEEHFPGSLFHILLPVSK